MLFEEFIEEEMQIELTSGEKKELYHYVRSGMTQKEMAEYLGLTNGSLGKRLYKFRREKYKFWQSRAEAQSDYILFLESKLKTIEELEAENKRLRELLQEAVTGHKSSWEWEDERMKWVEVQIDKETLMEIEQALEGGGSDGSA